MEHETETVRADGTKFSIKEFMKLIRTAKPKYHLLVMGILLLSISSGVQIYVPKMASSLVNGFSAGVDYALLIKVVVLFVSSALISALGGTILGVFGENVIQNLRKNLWQKLIILKVKYFDTVKAGETSSRLVNDTSQVKQLLATTFPQTLS
ncbi:MAG: ABC transporter transmembrane domain-containing protein, partial [Paraclostridium bifermentans]